MQCFGPCSAPKRYLHCAGLTARSGRYDDEGKIGQWRRGWDSNPRYAKRTTVFETAPFDHSGTSPQPPVPRAPVNFASPAYGVRCSGGSAEGRAAAARVQAGAGLLPARPIGPRWRPWRRAFRPSREGFETQSLRQAQGRLCGPRRITRSLPGRCRFCIPRMVTTVSRTSAWRYTGARAPEGGR